MIDITEPLPRHTLYPERDCGMLTESGIMFPNREKITEGKVLEIARECERLLESGDPEGFNHYLDMALDKELNWEEGPILLYLVKISGGKYLDGIHRITDLYTRIMCGDQGWFVYPNPPKG